VANITTHDSDNGSSSDNNSSSSDNNSSSSKARKSSSKSRKVEEREKLDRMEMSLVEKFKQLKFYGSDEVNKKEKKEEKDEGKIEIDPKRLESRMVACETSVNLARSYIHGMEKTVELLKEVRRRQKSPNFLGQIEAI
jgi:hypothetical protein